ncbi:MAG: ATP-binding protein [Pseudomonadota bacterium]
MTPPSSDQPPASGKRVSKYRALIAAVVGFIIFDISILMLNFYLADEIRKETEVIDIAARQRTTAQRVARAVTEFELLTLKQDRDTLANLDLQAKLNGESLDQDDGSAPSRNAYSDSLTREQVELDNRYLDRLEALRGELQDQVSLFDWTLEALLQGGKTMDTRDRSTTLAPIQDEEARALLQDMQGIWNEYKSRLDILLTLPASEYLSHEKMDGELREASAYARNNNPELFTLAGEITHILDDNSRSKTVGIRLLQFGGIAGALAFFLIIMYAIMLRFRRADARLDAAKQETDDILSNVGGGLFLLDRNMVVSSQHSAELTRIFNNVELAGQRFDHLLGELLPRETRETAIDYIELLLGDRVNEKLIADLNPMSEVEINFTDGRGGFDTKFLEFKFSRAVRHGRIEFLLVTVNNITEKVRLARDLEAAHEHREAQLELLMNLLHINPQELLLFIDDAEMSLNKINDILRESNVSREDNRNKVSKIYRIAHALKGDASALDLEMFETLAHQFEDELDAIRRIQQPGGNDFIPLVVKLEDMLSHLQSIKEIALRLSDLGAAVHRQLSEQSAGTYVEEDAVTDNWEFIEPLKQKVASASGVEVEVHTNGIDDGNIPDHYRKLIRDAIIQFTRNAIAHGIEPAEERAARGKPEAGQIHMIFEPTDDDGYELIFRDDGRGIDRRALIDTAVRRGLIDPDKAKTLSPGQAYGLIFQPGFSTAQVTSEHAGRGVGMDVVRDRVREAGGKLRFKTSAGKYTEFRITLPPLPSADSTREGSAQ